MVFLFTNGRFLTFPTSGSEKGREELILDYNFWKDPGIEAGKAIRLKFYYAFWVEPKNNKGRFHSFDVILEGSYTIWKSIS